MADKSWMLLPNQRNKRHLSRRSSSDFMAANSRAHETELQKTYQHLDEAYRASQRRQRREMMELRNFMRQVKTVIQVEMPGEKKEKVGTKPRKSRKRNYLSKLKLKEAQEEERKRAANDARKPSFARIGAVYAATSMSLNNAQSFPEKSQDFDEIPEAENELDNKISSINTNEETRSLEEPKSLDFGHISREKSFMRVRRSQASSVPSVSTIPELANLNASFGHSLRRSSRNKGLSDDNDFLPPIAQTS